MNPELSIIIPLFNEEGNLPELYSRLTKIAGAITENYELVFVNDGSKDQTFALLKKMASDGKVRYIGFSRNFGHQIAVTAGLNHCRGNAVVIIDADLQDPPELIKDMYEKMKEGYEVVYAKRRSRQGEGFMKKITAKLFYRILSKITTVDIPLDTGDFRIISRKIVDVLNKMPEQHKFLRGQISWVGFRQTYLEYDRAERVAGTTGYTYRKMIRFALDGITSFSSFPLKFASLAGFFVSFIAFVLILYALYGLFILKSNIPGWTSLMLSVLFIGGIQLLCIGIIGEYIGRISSEIRNRPLYVISETNIEPAARENNG
ncbi:MAG TPA: glycosyltransferase family 2 protein [Bacteroidia bacterium]